MTVFASTLNNKYFKGACVTLNTLRRNISKVLPYHIFLFEEIPETHRRILQEIYPEIVFHNITDKCYDSYTISNEFRKWNYNVYNRFEIFTLDATKIIFLDFDLLITNNIDAFIGQECGFGAVERFKYSFTDYVNTENFDAGVMIINSKFISLDTKVCLLELSKQRNWSSDEPVLNVFFNKHWTRLPRKYNVLTPVYSDTNKCSIIQFVGVKKPWHEGGLEDRYDNYVLLRNDIKKLVHLDSMYKKELSVLDKLFRDLT